MIYYIFPIQLNWWPLAFDLPFWGSNFCQFLGICGQFLATQSPCYHFLIAYNLGYLLCGGTISKVAAHKKYQFAFVIIVPIIATVLPLKYDVYGKYQTFVPYVDIECWMNSNGWQYQYVVIITLSLICHWIVIGIAASKLKLYRAMN